MSEEVKIRTGEQAEREQQLLFYKSKAQIASILIDTEQQLEEQKKLNEEQLKENNKLKDKLNFSYHLRLDTTSVPTVVRKKSDDETIKELQKLNREHQKINGELREEIKRLENIIDNARNYVENNQSGGTDNNGFFHLNFDGDICELYEMLRRF